MQRAQAAVRPHGAVGIAFDSFVDEGLQIGSEVIGRGANGIVYRGTLARAEGEVPVAVKMLAPGAAPTEHAAFVREFNTHQHAASKCRGVAQVFGCGKRGDSLCLAPAPTQIAAPEPQFDARLAGSGRVKIQLSDTAVNL